MRCKHIYQDGSQCKAHCVRGREFCFSHCPETRQQKHEASVKGSRILQIGVKADLERIDIKTPSDIVRLLTVTIDEVRMGKLHPKIGNTIGFLAGQLIKAYEFSNLDQKIEKLKSVLISGE
jgi:hypothetical protein